MKKLLALILVLVLVLSLAACSSNEKGDEDDNNNGDSSSVGGVKLVEEKALPEGVTILSDGVLGYFVDGPDTINYKFTGKDGVCANETVYSGYYQNNTYPRYIEATNSETGLKGIVDTQTGQEVVPCEVASITNLSARYSVLCFTTGITTSESEIFGSYWDKNGDTVYYSGYAKIFDYENGRFVPNILITDDTTLYSGNMSFIVLALDNGQKTVYNCDGNEIGTYYQVTLDSSCSILLIEDTYIDQFNRPKEFKVLGKDGSVVGNVAQRMGVYQIIPECDDYLIQRASAYTSDKNFVTDLNGNTVSVGFESFISNVIAEKKYIVFSAIEEQGNDYVYGLANMDGSVVIPAEYHNIDFIDGYIVAQKGNSSDERKFSLFDASGKKISNREYSSFRYNLLYDVDDSTGEIKVLFLNGTEKNLENVINYATDDIAYIGSSLYDKHTGKLIMENVRQLAYEDGKYYIDDYTQIKVYTIK